MAALDASTELWRIHASQWYFKQGSVWVHSTNGPLQDRTIGPSKTVWCYADSVWHLWDGKQWVKHGEPVHAEEPPMKKARVEVDSQQLEPHHWFVFFCYFIRSQVICSWFAFSKAMDFVVPDPDSSFFFFSFSPGFLVFFLKF